MSHETASEFLASWAHNTELTSSTPIMPPQEHDACGVGLVAALDGKKRRDVVQAGIDALKAVWHRGAVDADGKTGDGAGIHVEIPQRFLRRGRGCRRRPPAPGPDRASAWCFAEDRFRRRKRSDYCLLLTGSVLLTNHQVLRDPRRYDVPITVITSEFPATMLRELMTKGHARAGHYAQVNNARLVDLPTGHSPQFTKPSRARGGDSRGPRLTRRPGLKRGGLCRRRRPGRLQPRGRRRGSRPVRARQAVLQWRIGAGPSPGGGRTPPMARHSSACGARAYPVPEHGRPA